MSGRITSPPWIVRGEADDQPTAMGIPPAREGQKDGGWPYFIRQDRVFAPGEGPHWIAHGIQNLGDAEMIVRMANAGKEPAFLGVADGKCHNAEAGTFNHECGRPATWIGTKSNGFRSGFCDDCKERGWERNGYVTWEPVFPET